MEHRSSALRRFGWAVGVVALAWVGVSWVRAIAPLEAQPNPVIRPTPGWDTKRSNPGDPNFHLPAYPLAFVKVPVVEYPVTVCNDFSPPYNCGTYYGSCNAPQVPVTAIDSNYHLGTDVLTANDPNPGNELWIFLPATGAVKKLFPRPVHDTTNVIDFTAAEGSVVEPSLSEDGTRIYFAYYQNATDANSTQPESDGSKLPLSGSDLYVIDIGPLLTNPYANIDSLLVTRLTHRQYANGTALQTLADRNKDAMNPNLANTTTWQPYNYGTSYLHPTEVRTRNGLFLAYASDKRRLENANPSMNRANHNFNLHMARIELNGTLGPEDNQLQYYTTTSALSPTPLREGLAFSYQATTEDARMWHIQGLSSEGYWYPIIGYGSNPELYHLASFCAGSTGDYLVATRYYNGNNEGFGSLWKQNLDLAYRGKNTYDNLNGSYYVPMQAGSQELTNPPGLSLSSDYPSPPTPSGGYYGKFTTPRCGGLDELYFAYTPTSATSNLFDTQCNKGLYHAYIGYRGNLQPWLPGVPVAGNGHSIVIRKTNEDSNLVWPVPIIPWSERSNGDAVQRYTPGSIATPTASIAPGEPFAIVGTSDLGNTDRRPFECYFQQPASGAPRWYTPWGVSGVNQENDLIADNQDAWTYVGTPGPGNNFCLPPDSSQILGIAINVTSNKANLSYNFGYANDPSQYPSKKEASRLLGFYSVRGQGDQSFRALIPANVPFEFQAIDKNYGMKLSDVREWHSLKPQESRTDCGGCHQHDVNATPTPFDPSLYAATHPPLNMVHQTPSISYDANCLVKLDPPDSAAAEDYPEWRADVWPQMDTFCGSCHSTAPSSNQSGTLALSWPDSSQSSGDSVYAQLLYRGFASTQRGALGSQLFWATRGARTDNRSNSAHPANYGCTSQACQNNPGLKWGFQYSAAHDVLAANCTTGLAGYADWAFKVGKWIDNHMPKNTGAAMGYKFDWYHPTADTAVSSSNCAPTQMRAGWWDDSNQLKSVKVWLNTNTGSPLYSQVWPGSGPGIANGSAVFGLPSVSNADTVTVEVRDLQDNRQVYKKRIDELVNDCIVPGGNPKPYP